MDKAEKVFEKLSATRHAKKVLNELLEMSNDKLMSKAKTMG